MPTLEMLFLLLARESRPCIHRATSLRVLCMQELHMVPFVFRTLRTEMK
jgi:hypothetical protein